MAAHPGSSKRPIDDVYSSESTAWHGLEYGRLLAIRLLSRAAIQNRQFKLGIEVTDAKKFDDVTFCDESAKEWWLIQAKHSLESEETQSEDGKVSNKELSFDEMFFEKKEGNFSMVKYIKSYCDIKQDPRFGGHKVRPFLFTNRKLQDSIGAVRASVNDMMQFSVGSHVHLSDTRAMTNYLNYKEICYSLVKFFNKADSAVINEMKKYPNLMRLALTKQAARVKLSDKFLGSNIEFHNILKFAFAKNTNDLSTLSVKCPANFPDFWSGAAVENDPRFVDDDTVNEFFRNLVLSVSQPNVERLEEDIKSDWRRWMKSWIRPDVFRRLTADQLSEAANAFKERFREWEKPHKKLSSRRFLTHSDCAKWMETVESNLKSYVKLYGRQGYIGLDAAEKYYVKRHITFGKRNVHWNDNFKHESKTDEEFVNWLLENWTNQQCIVLFAEPGMGKSTLWQHLAFHTQQKHEDVEVFLIYLNDLSKGLQSFDGGMNIGNAVNILQDVISAEHAKPLLDKQQKVLFFMDGFDELEEKNQLSILNFVEFFERSKSNVKFVISSRERCKEKLEDNLQFKTINVVPLDETAQRDFLKLFWGVKDDAKFKAYSEELLKKFYSDAPRADIDFIGLPLTMKMLAEVFQDKFKEYLNSTSTVEPKSFLSNEAINVNNLYELFTTKCILLTMNKTEKLDVNSDSFLRKFRPQIKFTRQNYELLAMERLKLDHLIKDKQKNQLNEFRESIGEGLEESLLLETVNGKPQFAHLSYAEFFCATYLFEQLSSSGTIRAYHLQYVFEDHNVVRKFFLKRLDTKLGPSELKVMEILNLDTETDMLAVWASHADCANLLTRIRAEKLKKVDGVHGETLLHYAAMSNACEAMKVLLRKAGMSIDVESNRDQTPLSVACSYGHLDMVKMLVERGSNAIHKLDAWGSPLYEAVRRRHMKIIEYLINDAVKIKPEYNENKSIALICAAKHEYLDIIQMLTTRGANVNYRGSAQQTALHCAASSGRTEIVAELLNHGANIDAQDINGETPLHYAVRNYRFHVAQLLLERGATIELANTKIQPVLHFAAFLGLSSAVEELLSAGANVNEEDNREKPYSPAFTLPEDNYINNSGYNLRNTPLHAAAAGGQLDIVRLLVAKGAEINFLNFWEETAMHKAILIGKAAIVEELCKGGADINARIEYPPLYLASKEGHLDIVRILIARGAHVDLTDSYLDTALHVAIKHGRTAVVEALLNGGADISMKNCLKRTPHDIAVAEGREDIVRLLEAYIAMECE